MAEHQAYRAESSLAFRAIFHESKALGLEPISIKETENPDRLRVHVIFTNTGETLEALKTAVLLTTGLSTGIALLVPVTVPYPLPLEEPPVPLGFVCRRISDLAELVGAEQALEAYVYLCRNPVETVLTALAPHSLVVIGVRGSWPFLKSRRIARKLRAGGHDVVLIRQN